MSAPTNGLSDLIGGHPALDLINTISWRHDLTRLVDRVPDMPSFLVWAARAGLGSMALPESDPATEAQALVRVHALRENAQAVLFAHATGATPPAVPLAALHAAMADAMRRSVPQAGLPMRWAGHAPTVAQVPDVVAGALFDLLILQDLDNLRVCAGEGCGWLFLDRSRNHSRRWCSSADCGNRFRVNKYARRARHPSGGAG